MGRGVTKRLQRNSSLFEVALLQLFGIFPPENGSLEAEEGFKEGEDGCFAVEKRLSDHDFTTSMVDMIVQKQFFGVWDLEDFLWTWNDHSALLIWVGIPRDMQTKACYRLDHMANSWMVEGIKSCN